jgi:hypothetical protein
MEEGEMKLRPVAYKQQQVSALFRVTRYKGCTLLGTLYFYMFSYDLMHAEYLSKLLFTP